MAARSGAASGWRQWVSATHEKAKRGTVPHHKNEPNRLGSLRMESGTFRPAVVEDVRSSALLEKLSNYLAVAGIIVGTITTLEGAVAFWLYGSPLGFGRMGPWPVTYFHYAAVLVYAVAPPMLIVGSVGWLWRNAWARGLMLLYAWLWLAECILFIVNQVCEVMFGTFGPRMGAKQAVMLLLNGVDQALLASILPLAILALMMQFGDLFPFRGYSKGFEPIMPDSQ